MLFHIYCILGPIAKCTFYTHEGMRVHLIYLRSINYLHSKFFTDPDMSDKTHLSKRERIFLSFSSHFYVITSLPYKWRFIITTTICKKHVYMHRRRCKWNEYVRKVCVCLCVFCCAKKTLSCILYGTFYACVKLYFVAYIRYGDGAAMCIYLNALYCLHLTFNVEKSEWNVVVV